MKNKYIYYLSMCKTWVEFRETISAYCSKCIWYKSSSMRKGFSTNISKFRALSYVFTSHSNVITQSPKFSSLFIFPLYFHHFMQGKHSNIQTVSITFYHCFAHSCWHHLNLNSFHNFPTHYTESKKPFFQEHYLASDNYWLVAGFMNIFSIHVLLIFHTEMFK